MLSSVLVVYVCLAGSLTGMPYAWQPEKRELGKALIDGSPRTFEVLGIDHQFDPACFGLEFDKPTSVGCLEVDFASLGGRVYEPDPSTARLEAKIGNEWKSLSATLTRNYENVGALAPFQGRGWSTWQFRFDRLVVGGIRLHCPSSSFNDLGYRCIAPSRFAVRKNCAGDLKPSDEPYRPPSWLEPGADLAVGGKQSGDTLRWSKPVLLNKLVGREIGKSEYWTREGWRPLPVWSRSGEGVTFAPVSTTAVRVQRKGRVKAYFDADGRRYYEAVERSRTDMLGDRFRSGRKDLASMESLLLPIDFSLVAIGRPADLHETMVNWNGLFWMVEVSVCEKPGGGALPDQAVDRWFLPLAGGRPLGNEVTSTHTRCLGGWLPAMETSCGDVSQTVFVTPPGSRLYANIAEIAFKNRKNRAQTVPVGFSMGRRRIYNSSGEVWTPFLSDPQATGYTLDADGQTVRNQQGEIVFWSPLPGRLQGTPYETVFETDLRVEPRQTRRLAFVMPSVDEPIVKMPELDTQALREEFLDYWNGLMAKAAKVDIPEQPINDIVKNLLAQCLIITLDGDSVRYGAYFYEAYFGIEEGWPAVALAQYGFPDQAKRILRTMLRPEFMSKADYHHQYRNGLDPWYAITIGRLLQDEAWLREILPVAKECADWTVRSTSENKDPQWGGTLPKHIYGGDIGMPAYSFYSNATCWRGLNDTAWLCRQLGETEAAQQYRDNANSYRRRLQELADKLVDRSTGIPFLPMSFDLDAPSGRLEKEPPYPFLASHTTRGDTWRYVGNYWNLFAPTMMEVRLFDASDERSRWIPDYIGRRGGLMAGLARFDLGFDAIYGKGYMESLLELGRREDFWTSLYGMLAHGMSRNAYSCPEVSGVFPLRVDNLALYREYERYRWNPHYRFVGPWLTGWQNQEGEPLSAGPGMALQLIRTALVREDLTTDPPSRLLLLDGAPSHWFEKGKRLAFSDMRTFFGTASLEVQSEGDRFLVEAKLPDVPCTIRLPHPSGRPVWRVRVDGKDWTLWEGDRVDLPCGAQVRKIEVECRP